MFKFYLSFQINHKTHNWNKSQSLHHFLQGTTWHSPWLFLRGLTYNFPLPLFQPARTSCCFQKTSGTFSSKSLFTCWPLYLEKLFLQTFVWIASWLQLCLRGRPHSLFFLLLFYFFFHPPNWCFYYLSPSQGSKNANANIYHSRDLVKGHMGRIKTESDLKIRVDYMFSKMVKNKTIKISKLYFSISSPLLPKFICT